MLVDWDKGFWKTSKDRNSEGNHYRVKFRGGPYPYPQSLIEKINEGLRRCLEKVWKRVPDEETEDVGNMKLEYRQKIFPYRISIKRKGVIHFTLQYKFTPYFSL